MQKLLLLLTLSIACQLTYAQDLLTLQGDTLIGLPGRQILLSQQGFPQQITFLADTGKNDLLAENIHFHFTRVSDGKDIKLKNGSLTFTQKTDSKIEWTTLNTSDDLEVTVHGSIYSNGLMGYGVTLKALQDVDLKEITMHIPFQPDMAGYMAGLGLKMGSRNDSILRWKWEGKVEMPDGPWIGSLKGGLKYSLAGPAWDNGGKGGITLGIKGRSMLANNYSGPRPLHKGDTLEYNFILSIKQASLSKK